MHRRLVLTGALALAASPALAQSNPAPPTDAPAAPAPGAPSAAEPAPAPAMKMAAPTSISDASATHIKTTLAFGSLSLAASRSAADKVRHPMLKQFVDFEIAEQETIAGIIKAMMMPGAPPTGTVKAPTNAEIAGNLDAAGKMTLDTLDGMKPGPAFDRSYVKTEIDVHHLLLASQEAYLKAPDSAEQAAVALLAKGMITEHLALLADIEKAVG